MLEMLSEASKYLLSFFFLKASQYTNLMNRIVLTEKISINLVWEFNQINLKIEKLIFLKLFIVKVTVEIMKLQTFRLDGFVVKSDQFLLSLLVCGFINEDIAIEDLAVWTVLWIQTNIIVLLQF